MCLLLHLPPVLNCFILPSSLLRRRRNTEGTVLPNVRKSKTVLDFGFHLPGIGIPCRWILDSNPWTEFPVIWIPQAKPGLPYMRRHCLAVLPLYLSLLDVKGIQGCNKSLEYQPSMLSLVLDGNICRWPDITSWSPFGGCLWTEY